MRWFLVIGYLAGVLVACKPAPQKISDRVVSVKVDQVEVDQLKQLSFDGAPMTEVPLQPQKIVVPMLQEASVKTLRVRSVHDDTWIAFELEWDDPTRDAVVDVNKFTDQVAIQLPLNPESQPSFMMGHQNAQVQIIHWKAIWQDDIDKGYRDVQTLHPNYWVDMYFFVDEPIFAEGEVPKEPGIQHFDSPEALNYMPGISARNPVSVVNRKVPVEEAMAQGFGTFTTQPKQNAVGVGNWNDGKWRVIIARPLVTDDVVDAPILPETMVAFAVWDGSHQNVGARKHYSQWIKLQRE